ncbi:MAG: primosomal protein N' [Burkholderiales bacterium]|nr:primosomal protein N' [Burkholderiales bacterium]
MYFYNIALDVHLDKTFTYKSDSKLDTGSRVLVGFINKELVGFVWQELSIEEIECDIIKVKPVTHVFDDNISAQTIELVKFVSNYYHYPIGQTLFTAIPKLMRKAQKIHIDCLQIITLANNIDENIIKKLSGKHCELYNLLLSYGSMNTVEIKNIFGIMYRKLLNKWLSLGVILVVGDNHHHLQKKLTIGNKPLLNQEQQAAINKISANLYSYQATVLYGITGSGKTEVYLELIETVIKNARQVLVLVPEINLTPQLLDRFKKRFVDARMHILTSNVNDKDRMQGYAEAELGSNHIIIGTRLSVFTPFKNLGMIIVDEEHDQSFKQNDALRYNARDVAVYRAKIHNIPIVLGSATPSLETLYNYKLKKYSLCKLTQRGVIGAILPQIKLVDLNHAQVIDGLTTLVIDALKLRLDNKELSLIYINRRGYAPIISCYECGWVSSCNNCSTNMVYHNVSSVLRCHHCGVSCKTPTSCPKCNSKYLQAIGQGTQKVEERIKELYPEARVIRIDQDTTKTKLAWDDLYSKVHNHQVDILIGTQMLTKGHDFNNLTLVVGLNLDSGLYSFDFRATEYLFVQLMQVSGRAGRGTKLGEVLLQTRYPDHEMYQYLLKHDFSGYVNYLLKQRKVLNLPPYAFYVLLRASSYKIETAMVFLHKTHEIMHQLKVFGIEIFQPVPSVMQKLKNKERAQLLISSNNRNLLHKFINDIMPKVHEIKHKKDVLWYIDIDPLDI